ncbi:MAG: HNH endonuclease signature motif containing protein [Synergistaceae bacterium]|jgi:hypothetical protein
MVYKLYQDEAWLNEQYIDLDKSIREIANELVVHPMTIRRWIAKYHIAKIQPVPLYHDKRWLEMQYADRQLSLREMGELCGVCPDAILKWLKKFGIPRRSSADGCRIAVNKPEMRLKRSLVKIGSHLSEVTKQKLRVKNRTHWDNPLYKESMKIKFKLVNSDPKLRELHSQQMKLEWTKPQRKDVFRGETHPMWKGGVSFEPYCPKFNKELKEEIRNQYHRICQKCYEPENGRKLDVHHINFDKQAGCYGKPWNLIPLHQKCHMWTNQHRFESFHLFMNHYATNPEINLNNDF